MVVLRLIYLARFHFGRGFGIVSRRERHMPERMEHMDTGHLSNPWTPRCNQTQPQASPVCHREKLYRRVLSYRAWIP